MKNKIYVACPANYATGGPELLHQLCNKLDILGYDSYMLYYGDDLSSPVHERYKIYNNKYVTTFEDTEDSIVIIPETIVGSLLNIKRSIKVIWWLSVDNFILHCNPQKLGLHDYFSLINVIDKYNDIIHFVQSEYAYTYLKEQGINDNKIYYLSDYLNKGFIKKAISVEENIVKKDVVLYNPKKGLEFTEKIIEEAKGVQFIPLVNFTTDEMIKVMKESKVYIDFGEHPGKDRIPREAVLMGCCVITGRRGSARNQIDVPIMEEYKFEDDIESICKIKNKIKSIFGNYAEENKKFNSYRDIIINEEEKFEVDVKYIFQELISDINTNKKDVEIKECKQINDEIYKSLNAFIQEIRIKNEISNDKLVKFVNIIVDQINWFNTFIQNEEEWQLISDEEIQNIINDLDNCEESVNCKVKFIFMELLSYVKYMDFVLQKKYDN